MLNCLQSYLLSLHAQLFKTFDYVWKTLSLHLGALR